MKSLHSYLNGYLDNLMNARRSSYRSCCRRRVCGGLGSLSVVGGGRSRGRLLDLSKVSIVIAAVSPRKLPGLLQAFSRGLCNIVPGLVTAPLVLWRVRSRAGNSNCTSKSCAFCGLHRSRITVNASWHLGKKDTPSTYEWSSPIKPKRSTSGGQRTMQPLDVGASPA